MEVGETLSQLWMQEITLTEINLMTSRSHVHTSKLLQSSKYSRPIIHNRSAVKGRLNVRTYIYLDLNCEMTSTTNKRILYVGGLAEEVDEKVLQVGVTWELD